MLKFRDYKYARPDMKVLEEKVKRRINSFDNADDLKCDFGTGRSFVWAEPENKASSIIIVSVLISVRQNWAHILVPLYMVAKGCFLGGF